MYFIIKYDLKKGCSDKERETTKFEISTRFDQVIW